MLKKVLYFCASTIPTADELAAVGRLALDTSITVGVRCVKLVDSSGGELEDCDGVAGSYPTAAGSYVNNYDAAITGGTVVDYTAESVGGPHALKIVGGGSLSFAHTGTKQLAAVAVAADGTITDVTSSCTWTSGTTATATVGASTGLLTGVAAGTSVITATYTVNGKATVKTATITCT